VLSARPAAATRWIFTDDGINQNRVKLPKTFLAVNLSDAFSFQEKRNSESHDTTQNSESQQETTQNDDSQDATQDSTTQNTTPQNGESDVLEMKRSVHTGAGTASMQPPVAAGSGVPETETLDPFVEVEAAESL
jgi:hypothetical protein